MRDARVVVGVNGTPAGLQALRYAVAEARRRGAALFAIRVWHSTPLWPGADIRQWRGEIEQAEADAVRAAFAEAFGCPPADLEIEALVVEGPVAQSLLGYAHRDDDLLVIGSGRHRLRGVARTCLRLASCPVVVVPPPALARTGSARSLARQLCRETEEFVSAFDRPAGAA